MQVLRFDFHSLQDFRQPPKAVNDDVPLPEEKEALPPPPPPPPTFNEQELAAACSKAREEGRLQGIEEGKKQAQSEHEQRDMAIAAAAQHMVRQAADITQRHETLMHEQCEHLSQLTLMICRKVAGDAVAALPTSSVDVLVRECLTILVRQPAVTLQVHPSLCETMQAHVQSHITKLRAKCLLHVEADDSLTPGEGRLVWQTGQAERSLEEIWQQIEGRLAAINFTALTQSAMLPSAATPKEDQQQPHSQEGESL